MLCAEVTGAISLCLLLSADTNNHLNYFNIVIHFLFLSSMLCHVLLGETTWRREGAGRESRGHTGRRTTKTGNVQPLLRDGDCGRLHVKSLTRRNLDLRSSPSRSGVKVNVFIPVGSRVCLLSCVYPRTVL